MTQAFGNVGEADRGADAGRDARRIAGHPRGPVVRRAVRTRGPPLPVRPDDLPADPGPAAPHPDLGRSAPGPTSDRCAGRSATTGSCRRRPTRRRSGALVAYIERERPPPTGVPYEIMVEGVTPPDPRGGRRPARAAGRGRRDAGGSSRLERRTVESLRRRLSAGPPRWPPAGGSRLRPAVARSRTSGARSTRVGRSAEARPANSVRAPRSGVRARGGTGGPFRVRLDPPIAVSSCCFAHVGEERDPPGGDDPRVLARAAVHEAGAPGRRSVRFGGRLVSICPRLRSIWVGAKDTRRRWSDGRSRGITDASASRASLRATADIAEARSSGIDLARFGA